MPKVVDVGARRAALVAAVLEHIDEQGGEGLTVRAIAARAGMATGLVHHYFPGGRTELLHAVVSAAVDAGVHRMLAVLDGAHGLAAVRAVSAELLPLTPQRRSEWRAWAGLWSQMLTTEPLLVEQRERLHAWRAVLESLLAQAVTAGELPAGLDAGDAALRLAALLDGLGLHALVDPELLPPGRVTAEVDRFLADLR